MFARINVSDKVGTSKLQKLSKCIINGNIVKILFHVIADKHLTNDIVIGREIRSQGNP